MAGTTMRAPEAVDGRLTRTMRSRLAICDACLDLVQEGVLQPSADQIADRAGVSRRSIFYHFTDLAALYDAVVEAGNERWAHLLREVPADAPVAERVARLADTRSRYFEATAPFARALTAQSLVGQATEQARRVSFAALRRYRDEIERCFAADLVSLPRAERAEALDALASAATPQTWEYLRSARHLTVPRARAVMARMLAAVLRDAGVTV